jgi:subfamily B ATP-binding cassette protein MsbA
MTKPASSRGLYLRLLQYVRPYWKAIVLSLCATAIMAATEPMFPALLKPLLLDEGFTQQGAEWKIRCLFRWYHWRFLLRGIFNYFSSYGFSWVSNRVIADIRAEMYARMVRLPNAYFQKYASSVPLTKIAYDVNGVASAATNVIVTVLKDGLVVIGLLCWLLWLNWQLTLICFALIPAVAWAMRTFSGRLRKASRAAQVSTANMVQVLQRRHIVSG